MYYYGDHYYNISRSKFSCFWWPGKSKFICAVSQVQISDERIYSFPSYPVIKWISRGARRVKIKMFLCNNTCWISGFICRAFRMFILFWRIVFNCLDVSTRLQKSIILSFSIPFMKRSHGNAISLDFVSSCNSGLRRFIMDSLSIRSSLIPNTCKLLSKKFKNDTTVTRINSKTGLIFEIRSFCSTLIN